MNHVVRVANEAVKTGKCVVIGLQSTGEARTLEMVEKEEYLNDFVSTAKGVLQNLIQKHFPAPDRAKVDRILGRRTVLDDLGVKVEDYNSVGAGGKRRARAEAVRKVEEVVKRVKYDWDEIEVRQKKLDFSEDRNLNTESISLYYLRRDRALKKRRLRKPKMAKTRISKSAATMKTRTMRKEQQVVAVTTTTKKTSTRSEVQTLTRTTTPGPEDLN